MKSLSCTAARRRFGRLLRQASKTPIIIKRRGQPLAVAMSCEVFEHIMPGRLAQA